MNVEQAYNQWADQYDDNENLTRDLEGKAIREVLKDIPYESCLEIGCGTGKNTVWLIEKAKEMVSVDLSVEMLAKAKAKIKDQKIHFVHADINEQWNFTDRNYDLITFSLVLEHIENLDKVFDRACSVLKAGGYIYIGELHPFKQYAGSKARFQTQEGETVLPCFTHHISDFIIATKRCGLNLAVIEEFFDGNREGLPRIISMVFQKPVAETSNK